MIESLRESAVIDRLGWVLVHSLWQFFAVAVAAWLLLQATSGRSAIARYRLLLAFLIAIVALPMATWFLPGEQSPKPDIVAIPPVSRTEEHFEDALPLRLPTARAMPLSSDATVAATPSVLPDVPQPIPAPQASFWAQMQRHIAPWLPFIVGLWCVGVIAFALRPLSGWYTVRRLRREGTSPVPAEIRSLAERTAARLQLGKMVEVLTSTLVHVPIVVGYLRPVVLLPVGIVTGLPPAQIEAILAHELAHIRRHDYLINILQTLIETLFFYHPAVWWLSRQIRNERENCCDDLAVAALGNRSEYGRALLAVEELRGSAPVLALGVKDGSLLARIRRLVTRPAKPRSGIGVAAVLPFAVVITLAVIWSLAMVVNAGNSAIDDVSDNTNMMSEDERNAWAALFDMPTIYVYGVSRHDLDGLVETATFWNVTPSAWPHLAKLKSLRTLSFIATDLTQEHALKIAELSKLKKLEVMNCKCQPEFLSELGMLQDLEDLQVMFTVFDNSADDRREQLGTLSEQEQALQKSYLADHPRREHIIQAALLTDRALPAISELKKLKTLKLINTFVSDRGLTSIRDLPAIETLEIGLTDFTPSAARVIGDLRTLKRFGDVHTDDASLALLKNLSALEELETFAEGLTDAGVTHLLQLSALRKLAIRGNQLTDTGLLRLAELAGLESLDLRFSQLLTANGVRQFQERKPRCEVLFEKNDAVKEKTVEIVLEPEQKPQAARVVSGRVVDSLNRPVPEAEVGLQVWPFNQRTLSDAPFIATAKTDINGDYRLAVPDDIVADDLLATVWAITEGSIPTRTNTVTPLQTLIEKGPTIPLVKSAPTAIRILDDEGQPASNVRVIATWFRLPEGIGWPVPQSWKHRLEAATDKEGIARIPNMLPDSLSGLRIVPEGASAAISLDQNFFLNARPAEESPQFTLRLPETGSMDGRVGGPGVKLPPQTRLVIETESELPGSPRAGVWGVAEIEPDEEGRFTVEGIAPGRVFVPPFLPLDQPLRASVPESVEIKAGEETELNITVAPGIAIRGQIRKQDTQEGAANYDLIVIYGQSARDHRSMREQIPLTTDVEGRYAAIVPAGPIEVRLLSIPQGYRDVEWWKDHGGHWGTRYVVPADQPEFELPPIDLAPSKSLKGRLVDENGKPLADWSVYGYPDIPGKPREEFRMNSFGGVHTDEEGRFESTYPATYPPAFWETKHREWPTPYEFDDNKWIPKMISEDPLVLQVELKRENKTGGLTLIYDAPGDEPEATFDVQLTDAKDDSPDATKNRDLRVTNGARRLVDDLTAGVYQVVRKKTIAFGGFSRDYWLDFGNVEIVPGKAVEFASRRQNGRRIRGTVRDLEKKLGPTPPHQGAFPGDPGGQSPFTLAAVMVKDTDPVAKPIHGSADVTFCKPDGTFETAPVEPGKYVLQVEAFKPLTDEQRQLSGIVLPAFIGRATIQIPEEGEPEPVTIDLEPFVLHGAEALQQPKEASNSQASGSSLSDPKSD